MKAREIYEGGWSDVATQSTVITPAVVRDILIMLDNFFDRLNNWLDKNGVPPIKPDHPVGSTYYWERDLKNNPEKEYGDIDFMVTIPNDPDINDNANIKRYADLVKEFTSLSSNLDSTNGINVIFKFDDGRAIQVDLVYTLEEDRKWADALRPEYGVKGVISASLYSSIAEALKVSISTRGVRGKVRDGELVPFKYRKDVDLRTISKDPNNWAKDTFKFIAGLHGKDYEAPPGVHGTDISEIKIDQIVAAVKWLASALGTYDLEDEREILNYTAEVFARKMEEQINNPKFDKAQTPQAMKKRDQARSAFSRYKETVVKALLD